MTTAFDLAVAYPMIPSVITAILGVGVGVGVAMLLLRGRMPASGEQ